MTTEPDIERGPTWSPEHKHRCLVRSLAARSTADRMAFFAAYERRYGTAAAGKLHAEVKTEWGR